MLELLLSASELNMGIPPISVYADLSSIKLYIPETDIKLSLKYFGQANGVKNKPL